MSIVEEVITYKLILLGDHNVGKTSIINRYCDDIYEDNSLATIGIDTRKKEVIYQNKTYELQIWDTAGQERYLSLSQSTCKTADGIIFVFDLSSKPSFNHIRSWYDSIKELVNMKNIGLLLVGNKCDVQDKINKKTVEKFYGKYKMKYIECSAKENLFIDDIFNSILANIIKLDSEGGNKRRKFGTFGLKNQENNKKDSKGCC